MKLIIVTQRWPEFQSGTWWCSEHGLVWLLKDDLHPTEERADLCPHCVGVVKGEGY